MNGYMESQERAAARWALMQKRAQEIAAAKEAEQHKINSLIRAVAVSEGQQ